MSNSLLHKIKEQAFLLSHRVHRMIIKSMPVFNFLGKMMSGLSFLASIVCIVGLLIFIGFEHTSKDGRELVSIVKASQIVFIITLLYSLVFNWRQTVKSTRLFKWIFNVLLLLTALPLLYPQPEHPLIPVLEKIFYSKKIIFSIVGAYAVVEFSMGIIRAMGRKMKPSLMLAVSFLIFIIFGAFLLMMPRCTVNGIGYVDSLFVSTSAVCITGLTPVNTAATFTPFGLLILSLLIQAGGLGIMTFTSFFALFFTGNTSIYSQLMVKDMIYTKTINSLLPTLLYILGFTLVVELIGAAAIFATVHGTLGMSLEDELIFSGFHSLSAFCNAGFTNIEGGLSNPALLHSNQMIYIVASALIFAGGLGFPILVNLKTAFFSYVKRIWNKITGRSRLHYPVHLYDMNTKIVMTTTIVIFGVSALLFFIFEYNNSLAGMSLYEKVVQSVFNAAVPRSAGFASVTPVGFLNITIIMMIVLMWIGGGSQSTAGGIKVNTFAVILLNLKSVLTGRRTVAVYKRCLSQHSINLAGAVVTVSIIAYFLYSIVLIALEPHLPVKSLLFEAASALFTVGSSLGVTSELSDASKILLCTAMFVGRVGMISLLTGFVRRRPDPPVKYPEDNIIIN